MKNFIPKHGQIAGFVGAWENTPDFQKSLDALLEFERNEGRIIAVNFTPGLGYEVAKRVGTNSGQLIAFFPPNFVEYFHLMKSRNVDFEVLQTARELYKQGEELISTWDGSDRWQLDIVRSCSSLYVLSASICASNLYRKVAETSLRPATVTTVYL